MCTRRPHSSSCRSHADEGVATTAARTIMAGIAKSQRMLVESEAQYMALRGGMSDDERDVAFPPAAAPHLHEKFCHDFEC